MKLENLHLCASLVAIVLGLALTLGVSAQTSTFTYQGKLTDASVAANGQYDFKFRLFDAASGGTQIGPDATVDDVNVVNGIFTVDLDFGIAAFTNGAQRFLAIEVRLGSSTGAYTLLTPRQAITSVPHAVKSLNSTDADTLSTNCVSCVTAAQIGSVNGSAVTGEIPVASVPAGSGNYIQNGIAQQPTSNFNISGNGTAGGTLNGNVVNAATQYHIAGSRILSNPGIDNLFVGNGAGTSNTTGGGNSFFGANSGTSNLNGGWNSFIGSDAGKSNKQGSYNSYFGHRAGEKNIVGSSGSFFGTGAGLNNILGSDNTFLGHDAGSENQYGSFNTAVGAGTNFGVLNLTNATAVGARAFVSQSNSLVLGSINGLNGATADTNVGIGTSSPQAKLHVSGNVLSAPAVLIDAGSNSVPDLTALRVNLGGAQPGTLASFGDHGDFRVDAPGVSGGRFYITENGKVGIGLSFDASPDKLAVNGTVSLFLSGGGGGQVCHNASNQLSSCSSSSIRYKQNVNDFTGGLDLISRLRPVSFNWKTDNTLDFGLIAEEVAEIEPLLAQYKNSIVEGVKYDRIGVVLINAVKEQQAMISEQQAVNNQQKKLIEAQQKLLEAQQKQNAEQQQLLQAQQRQIDELKKLVVKKATTRRVDRRKK